MDGIDIYVTAVNDNGVTDIIKENGTAMLVSGMAFNVVHDLKLMLNFSLRFLSADDFFPESTKNSNNSIGYFLTNGQADIALGYLYNIVPRLKFGNVMVPLSVEKFDVFFHKPSRNAYRNVFREPFDPEAIICLCIIMCLFGLIIVNLMDKAEMVKRSIWWKCLDGLNWAIATLSQQAYNLHPRATNPIRILIVTGTFLALLLNSCYSASILAFLTVDTGILTYEHILNHGFSMFVRSTINSTLLDDHNVKSLKLLRITRNESIKLLLVKNNHAHLDTPDLFFISSRRLHISDQKICSKISHVPIVGGTFRAGFYCRKDFPHRTLFNSGLLQITEVGLTKRYRDIYMKTTVVHCPIKRKKYQDELGIENVISVFVALFILMILSTVILAVEKYLYTTQKRPVNAKIYVP